MYKVPCMLAAGRSGAKRLKTSGTAQSSILSSISFVVGGGKSAEVVIEAQRGEILNASRGPVGASKRTKKREKGKKKARYRV